MYLKTVSCFGFEPMGMAREPTGSNSATQATPFAGFGRTQRIGVLRGKQRQLWPKDTGYAKAPTATTDSKVVLQRVHTPRVVGSIPIPNGALFERCRLRPVCISGLPVMDNGTISS